MVPEGEFADLGRIFESVGDDTEPFVYDGFAKNITVLYTPPGGVEQFVFGQVVICSVYLIPSADEYSVHI
jgi:hypothetical protein